MKKGRGRKNLPLDIGFGLIYNCYRVSWEVRVFINIANRTTQISEVEAYLASNAYL